MSEVIIVVILIIILVFESKSGTPTNNWVVEVTINVSSNIINNNNDCRWYSSINNNSM